MLGKGQLSSIPHFRFRLLVGAHLLWISIVVLLGTWWGRLLVKQAEEIAQLEGRLGLAVGAAENQWHKTQRMVYWESATFYSLLLASTGLLLWLYWQDFKRSRALQAFFASVTHELRTPLTGIRLQAESIAESFAPNGPQKKLIDRLLEDSIRLEAQVERTLALARVEGGGSVFLQPLPLKPWLDRFLKTWTADYNDRVEIQTAVEDVMVEADSFAMQVIFKNILENSVKHSKRDKVQIQISATPANHGISLSVKDNGAGFQGNRRNLGRIFQKGPFSQGTGVGLYLVRTLMRRMGGVAEFRLNSGFEVCLWFQERNAHG